ncbi:MAG: hypothetical protein O2960_30005 [Verrucomicrobia bacterium]|nr:hypothetical protein [Verrucomicrobiota bacterium]
MIAALEAGLEQHRLITAERELLQETLNASVNMLTELLSTREPEAFGRSQKMRDHVREVAPSMNLTQSWDIEVAAMLARIGLMAIPPDVMRNVHSGLTQSPREKEMLSRVPEIGFNIVSKIPRLEPAAKIILYQSKNYDGSGFPKGPIPNDQIPVGSRVIRILSDLVEFESKGVATERAFELMRQKPQFYDMLVFEQVSDALLGVDTSGAGSALRLSQLKPGYELAAPVETQDGRMIVAADTVLSQMMLERLANFAEMSGIKEPIYVKKQ